MSTHYLAIVILSAATACFVVGTDPPPSPLPPPPGGLAPPVLVRPTDTTIAVGDTLRFAVSVSGGTNGWALTWRVSDSVLASVDSLGLGSALAPGIVGVRAILDRSGSTMQGVTALTIVK